jgi:hypothetical protein
LGDIQGAIMYDPQDSIGSEQALLNYSGENDLRADKPVIWNFKPSETVMSKLWVAHQGDSDLESHGTFYLATSGNPTSDSIGKLYISFEIDLFTYRQADPISSLSRYHQNHIFNTLTAIEPSHLTDQSFIYNDISGVHFADVGMTAVSTGEASLNVIFKDPGNYNITVLCHSMSQTSSSASYIQAACLSTTIGGNIALYNPLETTFYSDFYSGSPMTYNNTATQFTLGSNYAYIQTGFIKCACIAYDRTNVAASTLSIPLAGTGTHAQRLLVQLMIDNNGTVAGVVGEAGIASGGVDQRKKQLLKEQQQETRIRNLEKRLESILDEYQPVSSSASSSLFTKTIKKT